MLKTYHITIGNANCKKTYRILASKRTIAEKKVNYEAKKWFYNDFSILEMIVEINKIKFKVSLDK